MTPSLTLFVVCLLIPSFGDSLQDIRPEVTIEGSPNIVAIIDFHLDSDSDGNCINLSRAGIDSLMALKWSNEVLDKNTPSNTGLVLYDSCGSLTRALKIVGQVINTQGCSNCTEIVGLITFTKEDIQTKVLDVIRPFGIVHVGISQGSYISFSSDLSLTVAGLSLWKSKAVVRILEEFHWKHIDAFAANNPLASTEFELFMKIAFSNDICTRRLQYTDNNSTLVNLSSDVVVIFVSGHDNIDELLSRLTSYKSKTFLIVGDSNIDLVTSELGNNTFLLKEQSPVVQNMQQYLENEFSIINKSEAIFAEFLKSLPYCEYDNVFNHTVCSKRMLQYWASRLDDRTFLNALTAYYNIFRLIARKETFSCSGYDFTKCLKSVNFVTLSAQQTSAGNPFRTHELTDGNFLEQVPVIVAQGPSLSSEVFRIVNDTITYTTGNFSTLNNIPSSLCNESCYKCGECYKQAEESKPSVIVKNADIIFTVGFPVYKDSTYGSPCSELSREGILMTQSFLYAIDTVKDKYPSKNLLPKVSIGALIYDTCGGKTLDSAQIVSNSNCPLTFFSGQNNTTVSGSLMSDIRYSTSRNLPRPGPLTNDLASFKISTAGLSLSPEKYDVYLKDLSSLLKSLNWTYVSLVYSDDFSKMDSVNNHVSDMRSGGICISDEIFFQNKITTIDTIASKVINSTLKSGAIVLLTTLEDTMKLMGYLRIKNFSFDNVNFIFFAWNVIADLPKGSVVIRPLMLSDPSLKQELKTRSVIDNGYYRGPVTDSVNHWWVKYHENRHKCHVSIKDNTLNPNSCTNQPTFSDDDIDMTVPGLIVEYVDIMVAIVDELYKTKCPSQSGPCEAFMSFDDLADYIKTAVPGVTFTDGSNKISFTADGSLRMPLEVFNIQLSSEIMVATISEENEVTMSTNHIVAYDLNNSPVVIQHQCSGWCPSCYQCQTNTAQNIDYYYKSGDIDLFALFPIHSMGAKIGICDLLALKDGTEYLTEAFLYSINTAKLRYPYLLQGISVGSLIIDTCSSVDTVQQSIANFESCFASFPSSSGKMVSPMSVPSYLLYSNISTAEDLSASIQRHGKFVMSHSTDFKYKGTIMGTLQYSYARSEVTTIVNFLSEMKWTYVSVVGSSEPLYTWKMQQFEELAARNNICINTVHSVSDSGTAKSAVDTISSGPINMNVIILFLSVEDIKMFFGSKILSKVHIIGDTNIAWNGLNTNIQIPLGTIVIDRSNKINSDLKTYLDTLNTQTVSRYGNPWLKKFQTGRENCKLSQSQSCNLPNDIMLQSSMVVMETDIILHGLHNRVTKLCGQQTTMCKQLETEGLSLHMEDFRNISFSYQQDQIVLYTTDAYNGAYQIQNFQENKMVKVGEWTNNTLSLSKEIIRAYSNGGVVQKVLPLSRCIGTCLCTNLNNTEEGTEMPEPYQDPEMIFYSSSAIFNSKLWTIIILAVACGGVGASLLFIVYVIYKTCIGCLNKRYIGLGILLLLSITALYLSVVPFLFTPSEMGCTARHLLPGISYALVYATCLAKLMSLRSYKLIGLGGEISNLNQFLTVTFVSGVQIAISVQYVALKGPFVETKLMSNEKMYSCKFDRELFVIYLIYDMLLIVICSLYALTVRKEKKNMGEAIFILISSWINIALWTAWVAVTLIISRDYVELTICIGILACATVVIITVFVPKLHKISKLKYDVKKNGVQNGGYKIDTEFMFERPHTLPGGFRSSYNMSPQKTNPKSISTFDSSMSY
ncbi:unnamed protein product [Mytilus coruscus]|nr:unnamed protein product [Mytilus coruscus]